jgi:hypothetical protein
MWLIRRCRAPKDPPIEVTIASSPSSPVAPTSSIDAKSREPSDSVATNASAASKESSASSSSSAAKANVLPSTRLVMIGGSEAGKSTLFSQICMNHHHKWTLNDLSNIASALQHTAIIGCISLIKASSALAYQWTSGAEEESATTLLAIDERSLTCDNVDMTPSLVTHIDRLWKSRAITQTWARRTEFWHIEVYYHQHCYPEIVALMIKCMIWYRPILIIVSIISSVSHDMIMFQLMKML